MAPRKDHGPVSEHLRERVRDLHGKGITRNEITKLTGVSLGSVSRIVAEAGGTFDRSKTAAATEARKVDLAALRSSLAERLIVKAHALLDTTDETYTVFSFGGKDNEYNDHAMTKPPSEALRNIMQSLAIASKESRELDRVDGDASSDERAMLAELGQALGIGQ